MKLVVFGGSGRTGKLLLEKALKAGHEVTAVVRKPDKVQVHHEKLRVHQGDVRNYSSFASALAGADAVLSTVGTRPGFRKLTLYSEGIENILRAMKAHDVHRLICTTAGGTRPGIDPNNPLLFEILFKHILLRRVFKDMSRLEAAVMRSERNWTLVRPPRLLDKAGTGFYRSTSGFSVAGGGTITRDDLALFMLDLLENHDYDYQGVAVAN